jgi:hypothetical protein
MAPRAPRVPLSSQPSPPRAVVDGARVLAVDYSSTADLADAYRDAEGMFVHLPVTPEEDRQPAAR